MRVIRPGGAPATVGIYIALGTVDNDDYEQTGGSNGVYMVNANTTYWEGERVQWGTSIITPFFNAAAGQVNFGIVQLNGAAPVAVPFTPIQALHFPRLTRIIVAGGTGLAPLCVVTPGTGFALTGVLADLDTYRFKIAS